MRGVHDTKQRIKRMERKVRGLAQQAQDLELQHSNLAIKHHVLACCCDLMHWMRSAAMHKGWLPCIKAVLPEEAKLLQELRAYPIHDELSNPQQQPKLLQVLEQQQEGDEHQQDEQHQHGDEGSHQRPNNSLQQMQVEQLQQQQPQQSHQQDQLQDMLMMMVEDDSMGVDDGGLGFLHAAGWYSELCSPQAAAALAASVPGIPDSVDPSLLFLASPGDFLGPFREVLSQPPLPRGASMSLHEFGESYRSLVQSNVSALYALHQMLQSSQQGAAGAGSAAGASTSGASASSGMGQGWGQAAAASAAAPAQAQQHPVAVMKDVL